MGSREVKLVNSFDLLFNTMDIFEDSHKTCGGPKITWEMKAIGRNAFINCIAKIHAGCRYSGQKAKNACSGCDFWSVRSEGNWLVNEDCIISGKDHHSSMVDGHLETACYPEVNSPLILGIQYACKEFSKILNANKLITWSMSRKWNFLYKAVTESFFKTIKLQ